MDWYLFIFPLYMSLKHRRKILIFHFNFGVFLFIAVCFEMGICWFLQFHWYIFFFNVETCSHGIVLWQLGSCPVWIFVFFFFFSGLEMEVCFLGLQSIIQKKSEVGFVNTFISKFGWVLQLLDLLLWWVHESSIFFFPLLGPQHYFRLYLLAFAVSLWKGAHLMFSYALFTSVLSPKNIIHSVIYGIVHEK